MEKGRSLLDSLAALVESDPSNSPVRIHLATLLMQESRYQEALSHCKYLLGQKPDDLDALRLAAECCQAMGETTQAIGYMNLLQALTTSQVLGTLPSVTNQQKSSPASQLRIVASDAPGF